MSDATPPDDLALSAEVDAAAAELVDNRAARVSVALAALELARAYRDGLPTARGMLGVVDPDDARELARRAVAVTLNGRGGGPRRPRRMS